MSDNVGYAVCGSARRRAPWGTVAALTRTISSSRCRCWIAASWPATANLFERLHGKALPQLIARESDVLLQRLSEMTRRRHQRFGNTIFHLEPNLKDGPGGLRDCHVSRWIGMIVALGASRQAGPRQHAKELGIRRDAGGGGVSLLQPLLSALPPWPRRQHHHLGGAGGTGCARRRHQARAGLARGMDAALFPPREGGLSR